MSVERVMRAVVAIERDLDATFSLLELADHACLSPFHFHRLFTAVVGEPPAEYVRRLRLERAAHELSTSHRAVADIGREAGYGSQSAFTRAFGERFGCAPGVFRERERGRWAGPVVEQRRLVGCIETAAQLRFDCCIEVTANVRGEGDVGVTEVCAGEYATAVHRGPFDRLAETYSWLALDFMPREGRSMRKAPCVEIYLTPPERTPPGDLITEVLVPVR